MEKAFYPYSNKDGSETGFIWLCPGCGTYHGIPVSGPKAWKWDGNAEAPTFAPSVRDRWDCWDQLYDAITGEDGHISVKITDELRQKYPSKPMVCHFFIRAGYAEFCGDCTHPNAGKRLKVEPDEDRG